MMMRRRRGEECLARLPTPCRAPRRKEDGCFWSPEDPFAPTRTLRRTPPRSESESTQTSESVPAVQTAEASVQTEPEDPEHSEKEAEDAEGEQLEPRVPRRRRCRCGAGLWWLLRLCVLSGLIQAHLPDEDAPAVVESPTRSFLEREAQLQEQLELCGAQVAGLLANQTKDSPRSNWSAFLWR